MATEDPPCIQEPFLLRGPQGLLRDLVERLAAVSGFEVRPADDGCVEGNDRPLVQLLIEPDPGQWDDALAYQGPIVVVATNADDRSVVDAIVRGASIVISEEISSPILLEAVTTARWGGTRLTPRQATLLAERARNHTSMRLSPREAQILTLIARGFSVKQTSRELGISTKTVENLQTRLYRKLDVRNRAHAVQRGHALGLLPDDLRT